MSNSINIWLPGKGMGKARPRFNRYTGRTHMPPNYIKWKREVVKRLKQLNVGKLPEPCFVECHFINFFSSDTDNLIGSVLDAFVDSGSLSGDSKSYVIGSSGRFWKRKKKRNQDKEVGILVKVYSENIVFFEEDIPA